MPKAKLKKIRFEELPKNIQRAITRIFRHRPDLTKRTLATIGGSGTVAAGAYHYGQEVHPLAGIAASGFVIASSTIMGLALLNTHKEQYTKEELDLLHNIRQQKEDPNIKMLIESYPFLIVNRRGDLTGKRFNPKIGFLPIGRRRIGVRGKHKKTMRKKRLKK